MKSLRREPVAVVMVGIGGYGQSYLEAILEIQTAGNVHLCAAVEPFAEACAIAPELHRRRIPLFDTLEDYHAAGNRADLTVISSPIHHHVPQSCAALGSGSHVLCDKPLAATIQDADRLIQEKNRSKRSVMIGYQWSYSSAVQALKTDIRSGILGQPLRLKTLCFWPRGRDYYSRNSWAGRIKDPQGCWVLDSPANNAMAHFLHNLFYVLGDRPETSASPAQVQAETYRVYSIASYDSVACRMLTNQGVELLFYASHATERSLGPQFEFELSAATVTFGDHTRGITAHFADGKTKHYGHPDEGPPFEKLYDALAVVRGEGEVVCGPEAARSQTLCVNGIQESCPQVRELSGKLVTQDSQGSRFWSKSLGLAFERGYRQGRLPSEAEWPWANPGRTIELREYRYYPGGRVPADGEGGGHEAP